MLHTAVMTPQDIEDLRLRLNVEDAPKDASDGGPTVHVAEGVHPCPIAQARRFASWAQTEIAFPADILLRQDGELLIVQQGDEYVAISPTGRCNEDYEPMVNGPARA